MNKALKVLLIIFISLAGAIAVAFTSFFIITAGTELQPEKLVDYTKTISVFDDNSHKIEDASYENKRSSFRIENLN